ncbi:ATP-dependent RNA helicase dbp2, partial [Rhizophlyctis rosea]
MADNCQQTLSSSLIPIPQNPYPETALQIRLLHTLDDLLEEIQEFRNRTVPLPATSVPSDSIPERTKTIRTAVQRTFQAYYGPQGKTTYHDLVTIIFKRWMFEFVSHNNQAGYGSKEQLLPQLFDLLDVAIACTEAGCGDDALALTMVEDLVDILTIKGIEALFEYLEARRVRLIAGIVPEKGKGLFLLRFCTKILHGLSKSKNLMTWGNALLWMAHVYPLSEQSGVNLHGEFIGSAITKDRELADLQHKQTVLKGNFERCQEKLTEVFQLQRKFDDLEKHNASIQGQLATRSAKDREQFTMQIRTLRTQIETSTTAKVALNAARQQLEFQLRDAAPRSRQIEDALAHAKQELDAKEAEQGALQQSPLGIERTLAIDGEEVSKAVDSLGELKRRQEASAVELSDRENTLWELEVQRLQGREAQQQGEREADAQMEHVRKQVDAARKEWERERREMVSAMENLKGSVQDLEGSYDWVNRKAQTDDSPMNMSSLELSASHNEIKAVHFLTDWDKRRQIINLLGSANQTRKTKTVIFTSTKRMADQLTFLLRNEGYAALAIHGDKKQHERDWVMTEFKSNRAPILIATDVDDVGLNPSDNVQQVVHVPSDNVQQVVHVPRKAKTAGRIQVFLSHFSIVAGDKVIQKGTITLTASPSLSVRILKLMIFRRLGISIEDILLTAGGKVLFGGCLRDYGIGDGSTLFLRGRLRGGGGKNKKKKTKEQKRQGNGGGGGPSTGEKRAHPGGSESDSGEGPPPSKKQKIGTPGAQAVVQCREPGCERIYYVE